jgi:peptidoglycan/xylan/chitin deacetylase (PgdA/CDA1 family)
MELNKLVLIILFFLSAFICSGEERKNTNNKQTVVLIKLDDMRDNEKSHSGFLRVLALFEKYDIKGAFGVIGDSLEDNGNKNAYYQFIKKIQASNRIEFWNHGYTHKREADGKTTEFLGQTLDSQVKSLQKTNQLLLEKCGITVQTFGAPFNANDENTSTALEKAGLTVWFLPKPGTKTNALKLENRLDMEPKTGVVSYDKFASAFTAKGVKAEYLILQGHPPLWDNKSFSEFEKIVIFLKNSKAVFMTPYEYSQNKTGLLHIRRFEVFIDSCIN